MIAYSKITAYACLVYFICASAPAMAYTYYVSTTGSDSSPGTQSAPFRTIAHGYSVVAAGDLILVQPGIYTDYNSTYGLLLNKNGTASAPITIRSVQRGGAIIDGQVNSNHYYDIYISHAQYNIVDGFKITGSQHSGVVQNYGVNNTFINNEIYNNGSLAASTGGNGNGIFEDAYTTGSYYGQNYVHGNGSNVSYDHGLYLCGKNDTVVNNIVVRNAYGDGLQVAGYSTVNNMNIYHNTFAYNGTASPATYAHGIVLWQSLSNINIENNIFYGNEYYGVGSTAASGSGVNIANNVFYNNGAGNYNLGQYSGTSSVSNVIAKDPLFVSSTDFHLQSSSPAIGAGMALYSVTQDFDGNPRPSSTGWDIGAYVSGSSSSSTSPSSNLVQNGGFENGLTYWNNFGNTWIVSGSSVWDGSNAIEVGTGPGGVGQNLYGVAPGNYTLTIHGKVFSSYDAGDVGADFYDMNGNLIGEVKQPYNNTTWQTIALAVPVPNNTYTVEVWVWKNDGASFIFADDLSLTKD